MKPIIIKVDKDDNVTMKLEEFQKHLDDAYYQGRRDGESSNWWRYSNPITTPTITYKTANVPLTCDGTSGSTTVTTVNAGSVCKAESTTATVYNPDTPSTKTI